MFKFQCKITILNFLTYANLHMIKKPCLLKFNKNMYTLLSQNILMFEEFYEDAWDESAKVIYIRKVTYWIFWIKLKMIVVWVIIQFIKLNGLTNWVTPN